VTAKYNADDAVSMFCGIDEAGRGPVMGPLVVASVFVEDDSVLSAIGVKDSKKLLPGTRERMFDEILAVADHRIVTISAEEIDKNVDRTVQRVVDQCYILVPFDTHRLFNSGDAHSRQSESCVEPPVLNIAPVGHTVAQIHAICLKVMHINQ